MTQILMSLFLTQIFALSAALRMPHNHFQNKEFQQEAGLCDAEWGTFGNQNLLGTSYNVATNAPLRFDKYNDHAPDKWQGLFVSPEHNFAFCLIEKNACTGFTVILDSLLRGNMSANLDLANVYQVSARSQEKFGALGMEQVFSNPQATRAVFVRDPLARFVSAFLNKCWPIRRDNCIMFKEGMVFRDAVNYALTNQITNGHWSPQAHHCDLYKRINEYNVVGLISHETLSRDASCLFEKTDLSSFNTEFRPGQEHLNSIPNSLTAGVSEESILKRFFTPQAARDLIKRFDIDYETFHFSKEPAWIAEATGEWYAMAKPVSFVEHPKGDIPAELLDEDNIVLLSKRAGLKI